jgi:hypothetical protein
MRSKSIVFTANTSISLGIKNSPMVAKLLGLNPSRCPL